MKNKKEWQYEEAKLRDSVKLNLPKDWKCEVYKVTSGDSGKEYWVQLLWPSNLKFNSSGKGIITMCDCFEGKFNQPLSVLGLRVSCKHAENLLVFLTKEKKQ